VTGAAWWGTVPSPLGEVVFEDVDLDLLFEIAQAAILEGLVGRAPPLPSVEALPDTLRAPVDAFVTLTVGGALNGCIGSIDGGRALAVAVAHHAWSAAFTDPRLPRLRAEQFGLLEIEISVLSPLEPLPARSREELLAELRPHVDGLLIAFGPRRALFLPAVWEQLPDPGDFLDHLLLKAGMSPRSWPGGMAASRFSATRYARKADDRSSSLS